jgi:hypothetical protein
MSSVSDIAVAGIFSEMNVLSGSCMVVGTGLIRCYTHSTHMHHYDPTTTAYIH